MRTLRGSIRADRLEALKQRGSASILLASRLQFMEYEGVRRYLATMTEVSRVYPTYLPTQASGRWSITNPPLGNFPSACVSPACELAKPHPASNAACWSVRDVVGPDVNEWSLSFDWDSVEARLFMGYARDEDDLAAIRQGFDLHTLTTCQVFNLPAPPDAHNPHTAPACQEWRQAVSWQGDKDPRRQACKNLRYAVLQYGTNEYAAGSIRDIEKLGLTRTQLYGIGRRLLEAKPTYTAFKHRTWGEALEQQATRTFLGRRRRLFPHGKELEQWKTHGIPGEAAREGLNHKIQGAVVDMMNQTLITICLQCYPGQSRVLVNRHDEGVLGFSQDLDPTDVYQVVRPIIARQWDIGGCQVPITAAGTLNGQRVRFEVEG